MTSSTAFPGPEIAARDQIAAVVRALVALLSRFDEMDRVDWLSERLAVLSSADSSEVQVGRASADLHGVVLGMGGLTDLHLDSGSVENAIDANAELDQLADELFELTR